MEITLARASIEELLPMPDRGSGVHASGIIQSIAPLVSRRRYGASDSQRDDLGNRFQVGQAFEDILTSRHIRQYPDKYSTVPEIFGDGVYANLDMMHINSLSALVVDEIKFTWTSSRKWPASIEKINLDGLGYEASRVVRERYVSERHFVDESAYWKWLLQLRYYCSKLGTPYGNLHVCYCNGPYNRFRVDFREFSFTFTEEELNEARTIILGNAHRATPE